MISRSSKRLIPLALAVGLIGPGTFSGSTSRAARQMVTGHAQSVATVNTARRPEPILADGTHHRVYVGNESAAKVTVLDDRTYRILRVIPVGHEVEDLALDASGTHLYVVNGHSQSISVVNTQSLVVGGTIAVGKAPSGIALDPVHHRIYVSNTKDGTVSVIDIPTRRVIHTLVAPGQPQAIGVDTSLNRVFVALGARNRVAIFSGASYEKLGSVAVGTHPVHPMRVDSVRHRAYVVSSVSSTLSLLNTINLRTARVISTGANPEGLDISPNGRRAYVSNEGDPGTDKNSGTTVSIINLGTGRVMDTARVLLGPDGVTYDQSAGKLFVCDETPHQISVVALPPRDR